MLNTKKMALSAFMITGFAWVNVFAAASTPVFYPAAPDAPRIQFLKTINGSNFFLGDNGRQAPSKKRAGAPEVVIAEKDPIKKPYGTAVANGKIYVCDAGASIVRVFDLEKKELKKFGDAQAGKMMKPMNIAIGDDGTKYVADVSQGKVLIFNDQNLYVRAIGDGKSIKPTDLVLSKGKLYVADMAAGQVVVFDPKSGAELSRLGKGGLGSSDLVRGTNLAADKDGNIYVSDTLGGKISIYSEDGRFVRAIGQLGNAIGSFARAKGVALDKENRLYAVDGAFENVQMFDRDDKLLMFFGDVGNNPGGLNMPAKVTVDYNSNKYFKQYVAPGYDLEYVILVTSQFGSNRLNVYGFLKKL